MKSRTASATTPTLVMHKSILVLFSSVLFGVFWLLQTAEHWNETLERQVPTATTST